MSFNLSIPRKEGDPLSIELANGEFLFVLGPNGSGKSGLMQDFSRQHPNISRRISAHRQNWFPSGDLGLTPQQRKDWKHNLNSMDAQATSRWKDDSPAQRVQVAIYDLIESENVRARAIAREVDSENMEAARNLAKAPAPLDLINELLRSSNLPIKISIGAEGQVLASKRGGSPYSIAELSDGERNALLIAANVLTVPPGTLNLIDEPERHLHRSIISPLLTALFAQRQDCAFVISTHDISICADHEKARTLLIRDCEVTGGKTSSWDVDFAESASGVDEDLKRDILGSRRIILFVEGIPSSLDTLLYSLLFPDVSVVPRESCREVEHAVISTRTSKDFHWVRAFGLVDSDGRTAGDLQKLKEQGIFVVDGYSVESIYYHDRVLDDVTKRHCLLVGGDPAQKLAAAVQAALNSLPSHAARLSLRIAEKTIRAQVMAMFPSKAQIAAGERIEMTLDCKTYAEEESKRFQDSLGSKDFATLVKRYPLRDSPAFGQIAQAIGFVDRKQYEAAVRQAVSANQELLGFLRGLYQDLVKEVYGAQAFQSQSDAVTTPVTD